MLELHNASKAYRTGGGLVQALAPLELTLPSGCLAAISGPSGAGKSTLLSLIAGLTTPSTGVVRVDGKEISALGSAARAAWRAESIGFVFQSFHLLPYLTVEQNILVARGRGRSPAAARGRARELMEQFGIAARAGHRPAQLSVGERQRTAMARALLNQPAWLLADEPTGNLDRQTADAMLQWVEHFHRQGGSVIIVTHDEAVLRMARQRIAIRAGRLMESPVHG